MYSSSPSPPSHDCSPRLVRPGGRACAHAWPAPRTLSPFLAAGVAAALRARLGPLGDPPPSERGGPGRPRSLLSAAGGRVATFVNCKQTHVVLQQSRPCLVLVAFPPSLPPPPSRGGFLPLPPSSLSLGAPCKGVWGARGARGAAGRTAIMQLSRGSERGGAGGEPGGVGVCRERLQRGRGGVLESGCGSGRDPRGRRGPPGAPWTRARWRPLASLPPAPGRCLLARPGRDSAALLE